MPRLEFPSGRVFTVWTRLNGEWFSLVFDPGAQHLGITASVIQWLGLPVTDQTIRLIAADSNTVTEERPVYSIQTVEAFGLAAERVEAVEIALPEQAGFHGVLGVSFLRHFRFTVDFAEGWIDVYPRE